MNDLNSPTKKITILSHAGLSMFVFGIILLVNGLLISFNPDMFFQDLSISQTSPPLEPRMFAMLSFFLGYYYIRSAFFPKEMRKFYIWTVQGRVAALAFIVAFIIFEIAKPLILIISAVDYLGAFWTYWGVRKETASDKHMVTES